MVVSEGDALSAPDGVVITPSGTIYVADQAAGKIFKITNNTISVLLNQVRTGNPAGIALSPDADTLLISAHQVTNAYDQVLLLDLNTLQTGSVTSVVGKNAGAAGLHASPLHKDILSWDDSSAGPNGPSATGGKVYVLKLSR
jgi:DNA-binding beta-propeller fold protein YncE